MPNVYDIHEAESNLSRLVEQVLQGEKVTIARDGEPLVDLVAHNRSALREIGFARGQIWIQPGYDFDTGDPEIEWNLDAGKP